MNQSSISHPVQITQGFKRVILLMEEIRLTTWDVQNLVNNGDKLPINWCRISCINSISTKSGQPFCVFVFDDDFHYLLGSDPISPARNSACFGRNHSQMALKRLEARFQILTLDMIACCPA